MSKKQEIATVLDILALSEEEFARFIPDLLAWYCMCKAATGMGAEVTGFTWYDDGKAGEIHSIDATIKGTGEKQQWRGPAFSEE